MRPPSFEDFMNQEKGVEAFSPDNPEPLLIESCPTPGCSSKDIHPEYDEEGLLSAFSCGHDCRYAVKRNTFTKDITYFELVSFDESNVEDSASVAGIKINTCGDVFTQWY